MRYREVSGYLVGSAAFKAVGMGDPHPAGSIPVHLRHKTPGQGVEIPVIGALPGTVSAFPAVAEARDSVNRTRWKSGLTGLF